MKMQLQPNPQPLYEQAIRSSLISELEKERVEEAAWVKEIRRGGLNRFELLGIPNLKMDAWRFIDLKPILNRDFQHLHTVKTVSLTKESVSPYLYNQDCRSYLVFVNGVFSSELSSLAGLPSDIIVSSLSSVLKKHPELLQNRLATGLSTEEDPFVALNSAIFEDGIFLYLPENRVIETPIQIIFLTSGESNLPCTAYTRGLFIIGKGSSLNLITSFAGVDGEDSNYLNNNVIELFVEDNASVDWSFIQSEKLNSYQLSSIKAYLNDNSKALLSFFEFGSRFSRNSLEVEFLGEGGECKLNGLSILNGQTEIHSHTVVNHTRPKCSSDQFYKNILDGSSRAEFDGTIIIRKNASLSDAKQLNRNLILSDEAKVFTRPQLKIDNDDVKCSHGATVGQLNDEELFYLSSRGIPYQSARTLLILGYAEEIIKMVSIPALREYLAQIAYRNLNNVAVSSTY